MKGSILSTNPSTNPSTTQPTTQPNRPSAQIGAQTGVQTITRLLLRRTLSAATLTTAFALLGSLLVATPAEAKRWPGHPDRNLVTHVVRPGDTASGLSVRYHAWTREFIRLNGRHLRVGERVSVPVVVSAARKARADTRTTDRGKPDRGRQSSPRWRQADLSRSQVRALIRKHAQRRGVPVRLAQAVAWQESGWHQPLISSAGAIGVMQVLPSTGQWMSAVSGERFRLRHTRGNIRAGTTLLRVLLDSTPTQRHAVAAYYQGLSGIRNGWYDETKTYVRSVMAIKRNLERTGHP